MNASRYCKSDGAPKVMRNALLLAIGALLVVFVAIPLGLLTIGMTGLGALPGEWEAIFNTLLLCLGSVGVAMLGGIPVGFVAARWKLPSALESAILLPFAVPPYVTTLAFILLANPSNGLFTSFLPFHAYSLAGMITVLGLHLSPVVALAVRDALGRIDPALEEAARVSGATPTSVFFRISLPLSFPGLLAAAAFVASASAASFGVPYMLGAAASPPIPVLTLRIFRALELQPSTGRPLAASLSLALVAVGVAIPSILRLLQGQRDYSSARSTRPRPLPNAGAWSLVVAAWLFVAVLLPIGTIALTSVATVFGHLDGFTLVNWETVMGEARTRGALVRSTGLAAVAATFAVTIGSLLAHTIERTPTRPLSALVGLARAPWAVPGSVFALGFVLAFSQEIRVIFGNHVTFSLALSGTSWMLGLAYTAKSLAIPLDGVRAAVRSLDRSLEESARVSGATWGRTVRSVVLPLLSPAMIAGWALVFAASFCEVSMSVLLRGPGTEVLGTRLFEQLSYGSPQEASVVAMLVVVVVLAAGRLTTRRPAWS